MYWPSLPNYRLTHASVTNLVHNDQPFGYDYSLIVDNYAKTAVLQPAAH